MSAEWVLTEESKGFAYDLDFRADDIGVQYDEACERLVFIERAAVARALTVDNVARALHALGYEQFLSVIRDDVKEPTYAQRLAAEALIAALTEDVRPRFTRGPSIPVSLVEDE